MGSRSSKPAVDPPEAPAQAPAPVNIMITKEVTDRFVAFAMKQNGKDPASVIIVEPPTSKLRIENENFGKEDATKEVVMKDITDNSLPAKFDQMIQVPECDDKIEPVVNVSPPKVLHPTMGNEPDEPAPTAKAGNWKSTASKEVQFDEEVGSQQSWQPKANYQGPTANYANFQPPEYQEVDETKVRRRNRRRVSYNRADEDSGDLEDPDLIPAKPDDIVLHVPKPALPLVVAEDEEGQLTVEPIQSWNDRQRLQVDLRKNDAYWTEKLEKIKSQIEDDTHLEAAEFQRRLNEIKSQHEVSIAPPFNPGAHCNMLVSQIGKCYIQNENEVLKCNGLVHQFAKCTYKQLP